MEYASGVVYEVDDIGSVAWIGGARDTNWLIESDIYVSSAVACDLFAINLDGVSCLNFVAKSRCATIDCHTSMFDISIGFAT